MSTIAESSPQQKLVYGAKELKEAIKKNTIRGLLTALALFLLIMLLLFVKAILSDVKPVKMKTAPFASTRRMVDLPPPPANDMQAPPPPPPPTQQVVLSGPAARAGTPVPVPDAMIPPDMLDFANVKDISAASSVGGDGSSEFAFDDFGDGDFGPPSDVVIEQKEEEPDMYDFIAVEQEPYIDIAELQKRVVYPPLAIRAGVEGRVFIRVLVGENGKPKKAVVEQSDSELLEKAAYKAVMDSDFTPALQNGKPVQCWVSIPVTFKLR